MIIFCGIIGLAWSVLGATHSGLEGLVEMAIGAVFIVGAAIIQRLPKESK